MEISRKSGLTLYPGYWLVKESNIWTNQKLTLHAKRPYIRGPYKCARVYVLLISNAYFNKCAHMLVHTNVEVHIYQLDHYRVTHQVVTNLPLT